MFSTLVLAQLSTYDLIVEYEEECYNDSTLEHTYNRTDLTIYSCYTQRGNLAEGYWFELTCKDSSHYSYVHREPTFAGFREFVKRKYKGFVQLREDKVKEVEALTEQIMRKK